MLLEAALVTVDEGYAAVTQNNGRQLVLDGGDCHFLNHKNWKFEKFITMKIQTDHLDEIVATSADNIDIRVNSTINWRIFDAKVAATMAAETMNGANDFSKKPHGTTNHVKTISEIQEDDLLQAAATALILRRMVWRAACLALSSRQLSAGVST